jgi:hypothetical protein
VRPALSVLLVALPFLVGAAACGQKTAAPADAAAPQATAAPDARAPAAALPGSDATAGAAAPAPPRTVAPRPGGPSLDACQKAALHLADLVEDSALAPTNEQRAYLEHLLARDHTRVVVYCLEVTVPKEVECLVSAKTVEATFSCDRFRRELPRDITEGDPTTHREPSRQDCERFFDRLRGFQIEEGADVDGVDKDRDQIVRACQEKAKIGTVACFIASPTYEQARHCP